MNSVALEEELLGTKMDVQFACNNFEILCPTPQCTKITARTDSGQSSEVQLHAVLDLTIRETTERFVVAATMPMGYLLLCKEECSNGGDVWSLIARMPKPKTVFWPSLKALLTQNSSNFTHLMQQELLCKLSAIFPNVAEEDEDENDDFEYAELEDTKDNCNRESV